MCIRWAVISIPSWESGAGIEDSWLLLVVTTIALAIIFRISRSRLQPGTPITSKPRHGGVGWTEKRLPRSAQGAMKSLEAHSASIFLLRESRPILVEYWEGTIP